MNTEIAISGRDMMKKLIPFLNLDPNKRYTSITLIADLEDMARLEVTTYATEPRKK